MATPVAENIQVQCIAPRLFTRAEFAAMQQSGILRTDERLEWIDGEIVEYTPKGVYPRRFTTAQYYRLAEIGVLQPKERVELIEGMIVNKMTTGSKHAAYVSFLISYFLQMFGTRLQIRGQDPIRLSDDTEPEPDLAIVEYRDDFYTSAHPTAKDIRLLIEVSDSTVRFDRTEKINIYAAADLPEVWIIDVNQPIIYQYTSPLNGSYQSLHEWSGEQSFTSAALFDQVIECAAVFAPFK